jgi:hypothetical protein
MFQVELVCGEKALDDTDLPRCQPPPGGANILERGIGRPRPECALNEHKAARVQVRDARLVMETRRAVIEPEPADEHNGCADARQANQEEAQASPRAWTRQAILRE